MTANIVFWDAPLTDQQLIRLTLLTEKVFGPLTKDRIKNKLKDKSAISVIIATNDSDDVLGFKIGFEATPNTYYSWLGAVAPSQQRKGLGKQLMAAQHMWCINQGYQFVETKTLNKWRSMLLLNIRSGFDITGTREDDVHGTEILLRKRLKQ